MHNMKLLIFVDTHGRAAPMLEAVRREADANACIFLGDGENDAAALEEAFPTLPVHPVAGNCDGGSLLPTEGLAPFGGVLFFYTHGHIYGVKESTDTLWWIARRRGADVALYGHTHSPFYEVRGGVHLFNPGSVSMPRMGPPTYGRVLIRDGVPTFEIVRFTPEEKG